MVSSTVMSTVPPSPGCVGSPVEQVQEDVGTELVDAPRILSMVLSGPGEPVDPSHRGLGFEPRVTTRPHRLAVPSGLASTTIAPSTAFLITLLGRLGVDADHQAGEASPSLTGGLALVPLKASVTTRSRTSGSR